MSNRRRPLQLPPPVAAFVDDARALGLDLPDRKLSQLAEILFEAIHAPDATDQLVVESLVTNGVGDHDTCAGLVRAAHQHLGSDA